VAVVLPVRTCFAFYPFRDLLDNISNRTTFVRAYIYMCVCVIREYFIERKFSLISKKVRGVPREYPRRTENEHNRKRIKRGDVFTNIFSEWRVSYNNEIIAKYYRTPVFVGRLLILFRSASIKR